jgi:riboflavin biosynthesis pyrimidine reductase
VRRLLPDPAGDLTDEDLLTAYAHDDGVLRVNFVASADGAVTLSGKSEGLSGSADKRVFGLLRDLADVVLVAAGTIRAEGYGYPDFSEHRRERRVRAGRRELPTFAVISRSLELDLGSSLFTDAPVRTTVLSTGGREPDPELADKADVVQVPDLAAAVAALDGRVLCEGGPGLLAALLTDRLLGELALTVSPLLAGPGPGRIVSGPPADPAALDLRHVLEEDGSLFLRYAVRRDPVEG